MLRSLRFRLIAWFGVLLLAVVAAFGALLYSAYVGGTWEVVDSQLESRASAILNALEFDAEDVDLLPDASDPHRLKGGWELDLSPDYRNGVALAGYIVITDRDGTTLLQQGNIEPPVRESGVMSRPATIGNHREVWRSRRVGEHGLLTVRVGINVSTQQAGLSVLGRRVFAVGFGVIALGLLGALFIARLSVKPIQAAAAEAAAIGEDDLAKRLSTDTVPQELRGVVEGFNGTLDRLQAAFERQAQFTADASHELRTPVAIIRAQAEAALKRDRTAEDYKTSLEACARAAVRMTAIVEGLLTLARADGGETVPHSPCDLKAVVDDAVAPLAEQAAADGMTVACDTAPATVHGDAGLLGEVVTNLVSNALRYNKPGGRVDVSLFVPNGHAGGAGNGAVALQVRDTGSGIPAASLPHLFERFYRVDPARSRAQGGSGLGLAITKWIVDAHGGSIEVDSTEGEGTTFTVMLPATNGSPR